MHFILTITQPKKKKKGLETFLKIHDNTTPSLENNRIKHLFKVFLNSLDFQGYLRSTN